MATRTVTAPGGDVWRVRRVWAPRLQGETLWARAWRRMRSGRRKRVDAARPLPGGRAEADPPSTEPPGDAPR